MEVENNNEKPKALTPTSVMLKWYEDYRKDNNISKEEFVSPLDLLTWMCHKEVEKNKS